MRQVAEALAVLGDDEVAQVASGQREVHRYWSDPENNPDAAAYFITKFCKTLDDQRGNRVEPIPAWPVVLRYIRELDWRDGADPKVRLEPANIINDKSRKMVATWTDAAYFVFCLQFVRGWTGFATSKTQNYVDDAGHTTQSFFGRTKFIWDHLPPYLQRGVDFAYMRAVCPENEASLVGEAPTINAGRGGAFSRAYVGEIAHIPHSELLHGSLDEACPFGKIYESTAYGSRNVFSRIKRERPYGWRVFVMDWKDHPEKGRGLRKETDPRRISLYGTWTSPWFERAVAGKTPEQVAQELNRSEERSVAGRVYPEFDREVHVARERIGYDPNLPLVIGVDFGHARKTVAALCQPVRASHRMRIIAEYVGEHRNARENALGLLEKIRSVGYDGDLANLDMIPDPSALSDELSGRSVWSWYRGVGFTSHSQPLITGPDSVDIGITVVRAMVINGQLEVDPECVTIIEGFEQYHRPVDRITGEERSNKPEHDIFSHPMDGVRYAITSVYDVDDAESVGDVRFLPKSDYQVLVQSRTDDGRGYRREERDAFRPIMGQVRQF